MLQSVARPRLAQAEGRLTAASLTSGCSFSWDSSGVKDVLFGGKAAADIVPGTQEAPPKSATNADAAEAAKAKKKEETGLRRIAILPVAYADASGGQPCDLCPPSVQMKPTSALSARLVTGFIYEAIARHPRLLFPSPDAVEKAMAASPGRSMRQTAAQLAAAGRADAVVVAALVELRPRVGPDDAPTQPAGVALYTAIMDARTDAVRWSDTFDRDESGRGIFRGVYDKVMNDRPIRWNSAESYSEHAVDELIEDLVDELD